MSYGSFIKSLPQALRQPTGIAGIASVGLHGLLWIVLPILPLASKTTESEAQRSVQVVELTPAEQSRLPSFATPQLSLPPLPQTTNLFPSLPSLQSSNQLPSSNSSPYSLPLFPPPPTGFSFSPPMPLPTPLGLPTTQIPTPRTPQAAQRPPLSGEFQERPGLDSIQQNSQALQSQNLPPLEGASLDSIALPTPDANTPNANTEETTNSPFEPPANPSEPSNSPAPTQASPTETEQTATPATPPPPPRTRPDKIPLEGIAGLHKAQQREAQLRQQESYARDQAGTSTEEIHSNTDAWVQRISKIMVAAYPQGDLWNNVTIPPSYPMEDCPMELTRQVSIGVLVDAEDKIIDGPSWLQRTKKPILDQQAEEAFKTYDFKKARDDNAEKLKGAKVPQAYLIKLPLCDR